MAELLGPKLPAPSQSHHSLTAIDWQDQDLLQELFF